VDFLGLYFFPYGDCIIKWHDLMSTFRHC